MAHRNEFRLFFFNFFTYTLNGVTKGYAEGVHSAKDGRHRLNSVAVDDWFVLLVVLLGEAALVNNSVGGRGEVGDEKCLLSTGHVREIIYSICSYYQQSNGNKT